MNVARAPKTYCVRCVRLSGIRSLVAICSKMSPLSVQARSRIQQRREDAHEVFVIAVIAHTPHQHEGPATVNVGAVEVSGLAHG